MNKDFEKWALKFMEEMQNILLINDHTPTEIKYGCTNKNNYAEFSLTYPYKSIEVLYDDSLVELFKDKKLVHVKGILIHELCHAITDPLYMKAISRYVTKDELGDERERLTDHIANIVIKSIL